MAIISLWGLLPASNPTSSRAKVCGDTGYMPDEIASMTPVWAGSKTRRSHSERIWIWCLVGGLSISPKYTPKLPGFFVVFSIRYGSSFSIAFEMYVFTDEGTDFESNRRFY